MAMLLAVITMIVVSAVPTAGHPPENATNGINDSAFRLLWAGDADGGNISTNATTRSDLTAVTDIPLDRPPRAAAKWNRRDLEEMPSTDGGTAVHPEAATTTSGTYLQDVGVAIAGISPSTRTRLAPDRKPLYIAPNGTVLGTVDYRVAVPEVASADVRWCPTDHGVDDVRLLVDGQELAQTADAKTVRLSYDSLGVDDGGPRTLTLETTVSVTLTKTMLPDADESEPMGCPSDAILLNETKTKTVTVSQSRSVTVYDLDISGFSGEYPDGAQGTVVYRNKPWYGVKLPAGEVRGVWRYYVARDTGWDQLVRTDGNGPTTEHSPVHPVQVTAYPIETGPTSDRQSQLTILETYGRQYQSVGVPESVALDTIDGRYTGSYGIAAKTWPAESAGDSITAVGLVRGSSTTIDRDELAAVQIYRTNLSLSVVNRTETNVTVTAQLRDEATGSAIETTDRDGYLEVGARRVNTSANGTATVTLSRRSDAVTARYVPGNWWANIPGYVGTSTTVSTGNRVLHALQSLYRLAIPIGSLLVAGYLISRVTNWRFWPPWRGL